MKMKTKLKHWLLQIFATHIGRIGLSILFCIVGGAMSPYGVIGENFYDGSKTTVWDVLMWIGAATLAAETLLFIVYAWIINPIRDYKERKKK